MKQHYCITIITAFLLNTLIAGTFESGWNKSLGLLYGDGLSFGGGMCYVPKKLKFEKSRIGIEFRMFINIRLVTQTMLKRQQADSLTALNTHLEFDQHHTLTIMYNYDFKPFSFTTYLLTILDSEYTYRASKIKNIFQPKFGVSRHLRNGNDLELYFSNARSWSYLGLMYHF